MMLSGVEKDFLLKALKDRVRVDGRRLGDVRPPRLSLRRKDGQASAEVVLGGATRCLAVVSSEVVPPFPDRPTEGFLMFTAAFSAMSSEAAASGSRAPSSASAELARIIERQLRDSRAVDTEALCIVAGEKVWSIRCDIHVLDDRGNATDAAALAALAALMHFRRADVTVAGETVTVHTFEERAPVPLSIHHTPVCVTFAIFHDGEVTVVDPTDREELVMDGRITYSVNAHNELCAVHKLGGTAIAAAQVVNCAKIAATKARELNEVLEAALKAAP